jgi:response regulator RpfG family c-di-GMP phosphodiesterase
MGLMFAELTESDRERLTHYIKDRPCASTPGDRVLVVDDNASDRTMYKSKLILDGLCVFEAPDVKTALEVLERENINLLVVNPYMAKSEGFVLLASVAEHPDLKCIIRLALAPRGTPEDMKKASDAGVAEYLLRMSTSPVKLSEKVKAYLKR